MYESAGRVKGEVGAKTRFLFPLAAGFRRPVGTPLPQPFAEGAQGRGALQNRKRLWLVLSSVLPSENVSVQSLAKLVFVLSHIFTLEGV